jgi:regulator of replication initiation timing/uncharacterized coiled-coil protein SlyX
MTPSPSTDQLQKDLASLRNESARLRQEVGKLSEGLTGLRKEIGSVRQSLGQLTESQSLINKEIQMLREVAESDGPGVAVPVPADRNHPTDSEIRKHVLYHLYRTACWAGKHTSEEYLFKGHMAKVDRTHIWEVLKKLRADELLMPHGKSAEEQFSLNPKKSAQIYTELGIPPRNTITRNGIDKKPESKTISCNGTNREPDPGSMFVERGTFENTVRNLRERVESEENSVSELSRNMAQQSCALASLTERVDSLEATLAPQTQNHGLVEPETRTNASQNTEVKARERSDLTALALTGETTSPGRPQEPGKPAVGGG